MRSAQERIPREYKGMNAIWFGSWQNCVSCSRPLCFVFSLLPLFWKMKVGSWDFHALCLSVNSPPINFWMHEQIFTKLAMYIMATQPISMAYFINPSHQSVCVCVLFLSLLGKGFVHMFPRQRIQTTIKELLDACVCGSVYPPVIVR
jgi:hypothetical protein